MTSKRLLRLVRSMYPTEFDDEVLLLWLSQCENTLLTEVMLLSVADCVEYTEANDAPLLVPHPYDKLYLPYMQAMICQANGETDKYVNCMQVYNTYRDEYARWVCAELSPAYGQAIQKGYFLTAYTIAQAHGFSGTVEEWLESLKGPAGERGKDGVPGRDGVGADPKYSAVLQQLFEDGIAGFPYAEENLEGHTPGDYGMALILRTEEEAQDHGSVKMPSIGKVMELIRELGSGWVDVTEEFLTQQEPAEEFLRRLPQGRWELRNIVLYRAEIVEVHDEKTVLLTKFSDDPFCDVMLYVGNELVLSLDSEIGKAELFGKKVWLGEGGRTYAQAEEPKEAPDGSLWVVLPGAAQGIPLFYDGQEKPKDAPNGSVWLAPEKEEKPATPEGGITEETDPTVPAWAKRPNPPKLSELVNDAGYVTAKDLPSGGEKQWRTLATIDFSLEENQITKFEWTDLGGVTDVFIQINGAKNSSSADSGYTLKINDVSVAQAFAPNVKSTGNVTYWWAKAHYDGLVWNPRKAQGTSQANYIAMLPQTMAAPYALMQGVGAAERISLAATNESYKNITGTWEIRVR